MKILVTGASGFIGRHLVQRLLGDGQSVRALLHESGRGDSWPAGIEVATGDVRDVGAMKAATAGCETVYHLAGKAHALTETRGDGEAYRAVNVEGTRNVLEAALAGGAKRFVFFSSVKSMGEESPECRDESEEARPLTAYGWSKLAAENLAFEYGSRGDLSVTCLRLPLVYGVGNKGNLFRMIAAIDRGIFPPLPPVHNRRSMVHVSNVVQASTLVAGKPAARGRCYIVTDERPYSTRELYEAICRALGKRIPGWSVPVSLLRMAGRAGDLASRIVGQRMPFDSDALHKLIGSACYSPARIAREIEYRPRMTFESALPDIVVWYRSMAS